MIKFSSFFIQEYLFIFIFSIILSLIIFGASYLLAIHKPDTEKLSPYECGFDPYEDTRQAFDVRFYLVSISIKKELKKNLMFYWKKRFLIAFISTHGFGISLLALLVLWGFLYKLGILFGLYGSFFDFSPKSGLMETLPNELDQRLLLLLSKPPMFFGAPYLGVQVVQNFKQFFILLVLLIPYCYLFFSSLGFFLWLTWEVIKEMCIIIIDDTRKEGSYILDFFYYSVIFYFYILLIGYLTHIPLNNLLKVFFSIWFYVFTFDQFFLFIFLFIKGLGFITVIIIASFVSIKIIKERKKKLNSYKIYYKIKLIYYKIKKKLNSYKIKKSIKQKPW